MPRPLRAVEVGLIYHVINRGNNRQAVFRKKGDFEAKAGKTAMSEAACGVNPTGQ